MPSKRRFTSLFILAAVAALPGCDSCNPPPAVHGLDAGNQPVDCTQDSNYSVDTAEAIVAGEPRQGTLCQKNDEDFYSLQTGPDDHILELHLWNETTFTNVDLQAAVYNASGEGITGMVLTAPNGAGTVTDIRSAFTVQPGTVYYIGVRDALHDEHDPQNPYFLEITLLAEPDSHEPNNAVETPTTGACNGQTVTGLIASTGDEDWYRCTASGKPARLKIKLEAGAELGWVPILRVGFADQQTILDRELTPLGDGSFGYDGAIAVVRTEADNSIRAAEGEVFIQVRSGDPSAYNHEATGAYQLTLSTDTGPGADTEPAERNDTAGSATSISVSPGNQTAATGFLATFGDVDWYKIDAPGDEAAYYAEVTLELPADGAVPPDRNLDRVGSKIEIYAARLHVSNTNSLEVVTGCTPAGTYVHTLNPCATTGIDDQCSGAHADLNRLRCLPGPFCGHMQQSEIIMQGASETRVPMAATHKTSVAIRRNFPTFVAVSQFQGDDYYHEQQPYTLTVKMEADPDAFEPDDLPPELNMEARYSSPSQKVRECSFNRLRANPTQDYNESEVCPRPEWSCPPVDAGVDPDGSPIDAGNPDTCGFYPKPTPGCLPWEDQSDLDSVDGGTAPENPYHTIDCSSVSAQTFTATGHLSYVGDRDFFFFNLPPGNTGLDISWTMNPGSSDTEMGVFIFSQNELKLGFTNRTIGPMGIQVAGTCETAGDCCFGSLDQCNEAEYYCNSGTCSQPRHCTSNSQCGEDHLCFDEACFLDVDNHTYNVNQTYDRCAVALACDFRGEYGNPWAIEVTDLGQNDYDLDSTYTVTIVATCDCPMNCTYCDYMINQHADWLEYGGACDESTR